MEIWKKYSKETIKSSKKEWCYKIDKKIITDKKNVKHTNWNKKFRIVEQINKAETKNKIDQ